MASCGDSTDDALQNLKEAAEFYLEDAKELDVLDEIDDALTASGKPFRTGLKTCPYIEFKICHVGTDL